MAETKKLIPKRRFKESQNAGYWKRLKLNDITNRYDNLRIPVSASDRVAGDIPYYGANGIQGYIEGYTHDGEFILVAEDGANDLKNYPVKCVNGKIWVNNHAHVLQAKEQISDNKFIGYAISQINMEPYLVGGGRAKLNANIMMEIYVNIPKDLDEQVQLGKYFENIDNLITLQQRKLEKIKSMKKAYLYEMFPVEGESKPKRRFKGFTDDWEQRKLGDLLLNIGTGKSKYIIHETQSVDTPYPILGSRSIIGYDNNYDYTGDFILTARVGENAGKLYRYSGNAKITDNTVFMQSDSLVFNFYLLLHSDLTKLSFGSGQPLIKASEIKGLKVVVPKDSEEKNRIASFFYSLDNLITLHQSKLDKLKNLKKAYLNEMFI